jgi:hypothetical protein
MRLRSTLVLVASLMLAGCAGHRAPITPTPDEAAVQQTRQDSIRAADSLTTAINVARSIGKTIDALPLPTGVKDSFDCDILRIVGAPATNPDVLVHAQVLCGPTPYPIPAAPGPVGQLAEVAKATTSQPALKATLVQALVYFKPLLQRLAGSTDPATKSLGAILLAALTVAQALSGGVA